MVYVITGSREYKKMPEIKDILGRYITKGDTVFHGNARGVDRVAGYWAEKLGALVVAVPASWINHGKAAGVIRNKEMLEAGIDYAKHKNQTVMVLGFWDGSSKGTKHMLDLAKKSGTLMEVFI